MGDWLKMPEIENTENELSVLGKSTITRGKGHFTYNRSDILCIF